MWEGWTVSDASATYTAPDGRTLEITTELIDVTAMVEPDPGWRYTDRAGHMHMAARTDDDRVHYPTLDTYIRPHDEDDHLGCEEDGCPSYLGCRICHEEIIPGTRAGQTRLIPGRTSCWIDGREVSRQEAQDFIDACTAARMAAAPETYHGVPVPDDIRMRWQTAMGQSWKAGVRTGLGLEGDDV